MREIDKFYYEQKEPIKSCLEALKSIILDYCPEFEHVWKYRLPCFIYKERIFCYLWIDKKSQQPYLAIGQGIKIDHPMLIQEKRTWSKRLNINASEDIPIDVIYEIFDMVMEHY